MELKERLKRRLVEARQMSEKLLADFQSPEQWTHQVGPTCNHALWFVGHMAQTDNFFISVIAPEKMKVIEGLREKFGMGSQPTNRPEDYPPPAQVLATMRERREALLGILDGLSDEDLATKTPPGSPDFLPDLASVFETAVWHEGLHSGQLSLIRRSLGYKPLR
jgi:hypothetical protein